MGFNRSNHLLYDAQGKNGAKPQQTTLSGLSEAKAVKYRHQSASDDRC